MAVDDDVRTGEPYVNLSFEVKNTGKVAATEIAQVYISPSSSGNNTSPSSLLRPGGRSVARNLPPPSSRIKLQSFARVTLEPRQSKTVRVRLYTEQLGYYSREGRERRWNVQPGKYIVKVGASSADIRLEDQFTLVGDTIHKPLREHYFSDVTIE